MESSIVKKSFSFLVSLFAFLQFCTSEAANGTIPAVIAFGDSVLDTGNNNYLPTSTKCNFKPYGKDFPGEIPTGRFGNGRVFSDLIAEGLGVKSILPAYLDPNLKNSDLATGVCFASGGSGLDPGTATFQRVITMADQLNNFKKYMLRFAGVVGEAKANETISKALFLISSGINDIGISFYGNRKPGIDINTYACQLVGLASDFVKSLYDLGARKIAFMGTLPLGCLPATRIMNPSGACVESVNQSAGMFNSKLSDELKSLNSTLEGAKILYVDVYNPLKDLITNPKPSGFDVVGLGCCGGGAVCLASSPFCPDRSTYVFWDYAHPSERAYKTIVTQILQNDAINFS